MSRIRSHYISGDSRSLHRQLEIQLSYAHDHDSHTVNGMLLDVKITQKKKVCNRLQILIIFERDYSTLINMFIQFISLLDLLP